MLVLFLFTFLGATFSYQLLVTVQRPQSFWQHETEEEICLGNVKLPNCEMLQHFIRLTGMSQKRLSSKIGKCETGQLKSNFGRQPTLGIILWRKCRKPHYFTLIKGMTFLACHLQTRNSLRMFVVPLLGYSLDVLLCSYILKSSWCCNGPLNKMIDLGGPSLNHSAFLLNSEITWLSVVLQ